MMPELTHSVNKNSIKSEVLSKEVKRKFTRKKKKLANNFN